MNSNGFKTKAKKSDHGYTPEPWAKWHRKPAQKRVFQAARCCDRSRAKYAIFRKGWVPDKMRRFERENRNNEKM